MTRLHFFETFFEGQTKRLDRNKKMTESSEKNRKARQFYFLYALKAVIFTLNVAQVIKAEYLTDAQKIELINKKLNEKL